MDQANFQQAGAYAAPFLLDQQNVPLVQQGDEPEIGSVTVGDLGDFDLNSAGSDQIASNLLVLDRSDAVLPAFEQSPGGDLSLLHTGCQYPANNESFSQNLVPYLLQSNTELQSDLIPRDDLNLFPALGQGGAGPALSLVDWGSGSLTFAPLQASEPLPPEPQSSFEQASTGPAPSLFDWGGHAYTALQPSPPESQSNVEQAGAGSAPSLVDWRDRSLAFTTLQPSPPESQSHFEYSDALDIFPGLFPDLEQRPGAYKFRLVPSSDTRQAPSAGFAPVGRELSYSLRGRTEQSRCPRCRAQNTKCTRPEGELVCLKCAKFSVPVEFCHQREMTKWNPFEKWNDPTYEILFTAVRSSGSSSKKTVKLRHYPNGPLLKVECCEFLPEREDQIRVLRKNSSGGHSIKTTAYCLADMKFDISSYVRGYVKIAIADACRQGPVSIPFKLATVFAHVLIMRQCFEMYTSLILIMVECQFADDGDERETLGMPTVEERDSMWYGSTPVPRMIRNQLGHLLELNMIRLNREVKEGLLKMAQKKDRKMWIVEYLAAFIVAHTEEVDAGRNIFWSRYEDLGGFWIHPSNPKTLIDGAIASCNSILSHFHCVIKRKPLDLNWDDQKSKDMVDNDIKVVKCMKILQGYTSRLRKDGLPGRKAREIYNGDPRSVAFTITSLFFKSMQEGVCKAEDFR